MDQLFKKRNEELKQFSSWLNRHKIKEKKEIPENIFKQCDHCHESIPYFSLIENDYVCPKCGHHMKISARQRIRDLMDEGTWKEYFENLTFGGHDSSKLYIEYNGGIIQANAHNSFLQTAYQSGIMSGVSYLMIVLFLLIFGIKRFIKNADNNILFALMAMMSLFIYYCLSNILVPTISFSLLPMWIIIVPYIFNYIKSF